MRDTKNSIQYPDHAPKDILYKMLQVKRQMMKRSINADVEVQFVNEKKGLEKMKPIADKQRREALDMINRMKKL